MESDLITRARTITDDGTESLFGAVVCRIDAGTVARDCEHPRGYVELEVPEILKDNEVLLLRFDAEELQLAITRALLNRDE